jgi:integron integrase
LVLAVAAVSAFNLMEIVMSTLREAFWAKIRQLHRSDGTGKSYWTWIQQLCEFYRGEDGKLVSPRTLGKEHVEAWLNHLTNIKRVSESAHEQAFYAILFLYSKVCEQPLEGVQSVRPNAKVNVPVVMTHDEVASVISNLRGKYRTLAMLMYGCGLRRSEAVGLRLKDIDLGNRQILIWHSKHKHSRTVPIPLSLIDHLRRQIDESIGWRNSDERDGIGGVIIPRGDATKRKACFDVRWYWLFCSAELSRDPVSQRIGRFHLDDKHLGDLVTQAAKDAGLLKRVTCHTFRHSYATHQLFAGVNIREIQRLLGHRDVRTTMIYTHVSLYADQTTPSPLDRIAIPAKPTLRLACG